ncbi:hypothetical protein ACEU07_20940 [Chromobacterium violaceum]|uniref:hypothetical protein n=1 Tax=Chromobacterium violaceum TaxID=536 RepID=UPI0035A6F58B
MSYEAWIDRQCVCRVDFDYYREEAKKLGELCRDYLNFIGETMEGRYALHRLRFPDYAPLPQIVTHRKVLERLHLMVDFLCRLEVLMDCPDDGWMIERRKAGVIVFVPPTEKRHDRPEYGWHWQRRAAA